MLYLLMSLLITSAFSRSTCITNDFAELNDLFETFSSPKCNNSQMTVTPICHTQSPQGYAALWEVKNLSGSTCNDHGNFSHNLAFHNLVEEWPSGTKNICGAYWNGAGSLTLNVTGSNGHMIITERPACSQAQIDQIKLLCGLTALPIHLISFDAKAGIDRCVDITFTTALEQNSKGVKIQRSHDGKKWSVIADLPSAHPNGGSYSYKDCDPKSQGVYYYRLVQHDFDGVETKYSIKAVKLFGETKVFPNPAKDVLKVHFNIKGLNTDGSAPDKSSVKVKIFNILGQRVLNDPDFVITPEGLEINVSRYSSGTYILQVFDQDDVPIVKGESGKFIILH